ncbi:hypothetical protein NLO88_12680 [Pseudomonas syringae]|nr:hypothetical protein [Pseudomonas syringae]MCQ3031514.1 hypothetical protein [Pseudomonas syringae]MDG6399367.1 hypothetical protein [Pseudomonas quasicaspiana]
MSLCLSCTKPKSITATRLQTVTSTGAGLLDRIDQWSNTAMMTVYFVVMTMCSGMEGCVEERKAGDAYASREECMTKVSAITRRKGVKYKCRSEPQWVLKEDRRVEGAKSFVTTGAK